jgi:hypothetical protein
MAIVNVQQWQIPCKHCNLLTIEIQMQHLCTGHVVVTLLHKIFGNPSLLHACACRLQELSIGA